MIERLLPARPDSGLQISRFAVTIAVVVLALGAALLAPSVLAQDAQEKPAAPADTPPEKLELRDFAGIWKAAFEGKTFAVLTLKMQEGKLIGVIRTGEVDLSDDGEVSKVNQEAGDPRVIFDVQLNGQTLTFKDRDGEDVNSLEMTLTGANRAELKFILPDPLPEGMPVPKPFRMTRGEKGQHISNESDLVAPVLPAAGWLQPGTSFVPDPLLKGFL